MGHRTLTLWTNTKSDNTNKNKNALPYFCSSSLPLASTRWVKSKILSLYPLPYLINLTNIHIFSTEKISGMLIIKPAAAGSNYVNHYAMCPPHPPPL